MTTDKRRKHSAEVVDGLSKAPGRAMLRAVGFTDEDFTKPQIGIASTWSNVTPCNMHINVLADEAARGADAAGGKGVIFNTITISDGIANGTEGMKYSLVSREIIADSIETVAGCEGFDGLVAIGEIGRASCRERVWVSVGAGALNAKGMLRRRRADVRYEVGGH